MNRPITTTTASTDDQSVAPSDAPADSTPATTPLVAHVGNTLELTGNDSERLQVTVRKVIDPAPAKDEFSGPDAGNRLVSIELKYKNTGRTTYKDSVGNETTLTDATGHSFSSNLEDSGAGPGFADDEVNIAPGEIADGFVTFQVPTGDAPALLKISLDSGFADDAGEWRIP